METMSPEDQAFQNFKNSVSQFEEAYPTCVAILCCLGNGEKHKSEEIARGFGAESGKYLGLLLKGNLVNQENDSYFITDLGKTVLNAVDTHYTP